MVGSQEGSQKASPRGQKDSPGGSQKDFRRGSPGGSVAGHSRDYREASPAGSTHSNNDDEDSIFGDLAEASPDPQLGPARRSSVTAELQQLGLDSNPGIDLSHLALDSSSSLDLSHLEPKSTTPVGSPPASSPIFQITPNPNPPASHLPSPLTDIPAAVLQQRGTPGPNTPGPNTLDHNTLDPNTLDPIPPSSSSQSPSSPGLSQPAPTPAQSASRAKADRKQKRKEAMEREADRRRNEALRIQDEAVKTLRDQLKAGRLAICVGSGVTIYSAPTQVQRLSWWGLMSSALDYFEDQAANPSRHATNQADITSVRRILQKSEPTEADREDVTNRIQKLLASRIDLEATWLRAQFQNLHRDYVDQVELLDAIKALYDQGAILFTTNYDGLLETHCNLDPIDASDPRGLASWRRGSRPAVFHPHGYWRNPDHVVLSTEQYWRVQNDVIIQDTLQHILATKTVLFVGCGGDPNFGPLIQWAGRRSGGSSSSHYILLERAEQNPVTQLTLTHLRSESLEDIPRFLKDILDPISRREGMISEVPTGRERRRIHEWLAPIDQSAFLNDMLNLQGPNRFDRQVTQSEDVWTLNKPSRVRLRGLEGFGKTMFCASVIQNALKQCRLGNVNRNRDSLAYFFTVTYRPNEEGPSLEYHDFNQFLRTVILQLTPLDVVFPPLQNLYTECTRYHPARLPTSAELQVVLLQILWHLDKPQAPNKRDPVPPGNTYLIIDELESLEPNLRGDYSRFIKLLASQPFEHFHLLVTAESPLTVGIDPPPRSTPGRKSRKRGRKRGAHKLFSTIAPIPTTAPTNWSEVTLDWASTSTALVEWLRDRFLNDPSLAHFSNIRHEIISHIQATGQNLRWVYWRLNRLSQIQGAESLDDDALRNEAEAILQAGNSSSSSSGSDSYYSGGSNNNPPRSRKRLRGQNRRDRKRIKVGLSP
ncbi:SIR2-like domain-containing protein [Nemania sp. FL0031]|nr:SIR2-like domain-containing protein [Nemania sp. FL0031]